MSLLHCCTVFQPVLGAIQAKPISLFLEQSKPSSFLLKQLPIYVSKVGNTKGWILLQCSWDMLLWASQALGASVFFCTKQRYQEHLPHSLMRLKRDCFTYTLHLCNCSAHSKSSININHVNMSTVRIWLGFFKRKKKNLWLTESQPRNFSKHWWLPSPHGSNPAS